MRWIGLGGKGGGRPDLGGEGVREHGVGRTARCRGGIGRGVGGWYRDVSGGWDGLDRLVSGIMEKDGSFVRWGDDLDRRINNGGL